MSEFVICLTTVGSRRDAEKIARRLVREKLAACVNLLPGALSFYHWKKKLRRDREVVLIMKTAASKISSLEKELQKIHPYDLPEFVVLPMIGGSRRYLNWLKGEIRSQ